MRVPVIKEKKKIWAAGFCVLGIMLLLPISVPSDERGEKTGYQKETAWKKNKSGICELAGKEILTFLAPVFPFATQDGIRGYGSLMESAFLSQIPVFSYARENGQRELPVQDEDAWRQMLLTEEEEKEDDAQKDMVEEQDIEEALTMEEALQKENETARAKEQIQEEEINVEELPNEISEGIFIPHERQLTYNLADYQDFTALFDTFYAMDSNTMIGQDELNLESLMGPDVTVKKEAPGPKILLYHTHSQEAFVDSVPGDKSTTIVGAGDKLAELLTEQYGYSVLHHTGEYDLPGRDGAYNRSLPALEQILAENPSIQIIIDLHRDGISEDRKLVTDLDGRPTARFMFFNGLSRTKSTGDIDYLKNPYQAENLALSFRLEMAAGEFYPGLTRKIYLNGYRYNMHLRKSLLIELGAQTNTVEEIMNAIDPLAHILDLVLSGESTQ